MLKKIQWWLAVISTMVFLLGCCKLADYITEQTRKSFETDSIEWQNEIVNQTFMGENIYDYMDVPYDCEKVQQSCEIIEDQAVCMIIEIMVEGCDR